MQERDARKGLVSCRKDLKQRAGKSRLTHHTVTCTHSACMRERVKERSDGRKTDRDSLNTPSDGPS